jgi:type IV secretion system protein TrbL
VRGRTRLVAAVVIGALLAASPAQAAILDGIVTSYQTVSSSWLSALVPIAQQLFGLLAALEIAVGAIVWLFARRSVDEMLLSFVRKILVLGVFYAFLTQFPLWLPRIVQGFQTAGQAASQSPALSPSGVLQAGIDLAAKLSQAADQAGLFTTGPVMIFSPLITLLVLIAFVAISAQLVMTLVESFIVVTGGALFLGFAAFRGTAPLADRAIGYAVYVGIKLFLLYLLVGTGLTQMGAWTAELAQTSTAGANFQPLFDVLGGSLVFALLVWKVPNQVAQFLTSGVSFQLREALTD